MIHKKNFTDLRTQYSKFSFDEINIIESDNILHISYVYKIHVNEEAENSESVEDINFTHSIIVNKKTSENLPAEDISAAIFYLGVAEMVNYWKISCAKIIEINTGFLDTYQENWFKNLFYNGLGEFIYINNIVVSEKDFFEFHYSEKLKQDCKDANGSKFAPLSNILLSETILLPVGGGKDSIVSYELLKPEFSKALTLFSVNPIEATKRLFKKAEESEENIQNIQVQRILDKKIVHCNGDGFLNGHVPFSALLGFITVLTSLVHGKKYILLSNESSANEENVIFEGLKVNHQFSKSLKFEDDFRSFVNKYIHPYLEYISFLRPLSEIQIGKIFAEFPENFPIFKSCNSGSKKDIWCNACPKCLFAYIILFPFVGKENMLTIFGQDLFENSDMQEMFHDLVDESRVKPFECVGTYSEVNLALRMSFYQYNAESIKDFPILLQEYIATYSNDGFEELDVLENSEELTKIDEENNNLDKIPSKFFDVIKREFE
ncbi:TPA: hypothetical protein EYG84_02385 [Candidatus Gracilibacteria bacterium]|nr:hypothetical protein [Candidatus Gracilibacteria bacterium]